MAKTNWQDPKTGEIISPQISGLQEAVGKLEDSIGMDTVSETDIPLTEVFISGEDRYRIFQAPEGKRNWVSSPAPVIKKNGVAISTGFVVDYGGGAIALSVNDMGGYTYTADATYITPLETSVKTHKAEIAAQIENIKGYIGYTSNDIYGIEVDIPNNTIVRLAGAVGKSAGVGFDNVKTFGGRRRCNLADDRTVLAYYGDAGYKEDGTNGQVMVEQPKFYYKRVPLVLEPIQDGTGYHLRKWRDYVSDYPKAGFKVHPAFIRDGVEYDKIYYPAYEGSIYDTSAGAYLLADEQIADFNADKLSSIVGAKPASGLSQNLTIVNTRKLANNRGEGWQQIDIIAHYAEVLLMSIEYATFDEQTAIGQGVVTFADDAASNMAVNTGATSFLGNASGMAPGTNGKVSISYRGRENGWGNIWKWNDGLNIECKGIHEAYWADSNFVSDIKTEPYKPCGFTLAKTNGYISAIGYHQDCDFMYIPSETLGASNRPLNDYFYQNNEYNGFLVAPLGGDWNSGSHAGACCLYARSSSGTRSRAVGGGLLCVPVN